MKPIMKAIMKAREHEFKHVIEGAFIISVQCQWCEVKSSDLITFAFSNYNKLNSDLPPCISDEEKIIKKLLE